MTMRKHYENIKKLLAKEIDPAFARRARIILENLDIKPGMRILEVGCGRGFYEAAVVKIYPGVKIVGVDLNEKYLEVARRAVKDDNVTFLKADATKLPFGNGEFDRIICTEVLEHIRDDERVIREIFRVLKPRGKVLITVPNKDYPFFWDPVNFILERLFKWHIPSNIWWLAGIWADHVRLYSEEELLRKIEGVGGKERLGGLGFKIEEIWRSTSYCFPFSHFLLYGIGKNLVERGLLGGSFNRFDFRSKPSIFLRLVKLSFAVFDRGNMGNKSDKGERFLNLVVKVRKT